MLKLTGLFVRHFFIFKLFFNFEYFDLIMSLCRMSLTHHFFVMSLFFFILNMIVHVINQFQIH